MKITVSTSEGMFYNIDTRGILYKNLNGYLVQALVKTACNEMAENDFKVIGWKAYHKRTVKKERIICTCKKCGKNILKAKTYKDNLGRCSRCGSQLYKREVRAVGIKDEITDFWDGVI